MENKVLEEGQETSIMHHTPNGTYIHVLYMYYMYTRPEGACHEHAREDQPVPPLQLKRPARKQGRGGGGGWGGRGGREGEGGEGDRSCNTQLTSLPLFPSHTCRER